MKLIDFLRAKGINLDEDMTEETDQKEDASKGTEVQNDTEKEELINAVKDLTQQLKDTVDANKELALQGEKSEPQPTFESTLYDMFAIKEV